MVSWCKQSLTELLHFSYVFPLSVCAFEKWAGWRCAEPHTQRLTIMHTYRHTLTLWSRGMSPGPQCFHRQDWDKEWGWLLKERWVTRAAAPRCAFTAACPVWSFHCGQPVRTSPLSSMHTCTPVGAHTQRSKALTASSFKEIVAKNENLVIVYSPSCHSWVFSCHLCSVFIWSCMIFMSFIYINVCGRRFAIQSDLYYIQGMHFISSCIFSESNPWPWGW